MLSSIDFCSSLSFSSVDLIPVRKAFITPGIAVVIAEISENIGFAVVAKVNKPEPTPEKTEPMPCFQALAVLLLSDNPLIEAIAPRELIAVPIAAVVVPPLFKAPQTPRNPPP